MRRDVSVERFFTALISGHRSAARAVIDHELDREAEAADLLEGLFWPVIQQIQHLHRFDQLSDLSYSYATRELNNLLGQMQLRLPQPEESGRRVLVTCGCEASEELAGRMTADLLESAGYEVYFAGGGIAQDELVAQIGELEADVLVIFGATPQTVPYSRLLIDRLHDIGVCPKLQIAVGGGVFNRAEGLAEEIGADVWASTPCEMVAVVDEFPQKRMGPDQRTVGRRRRSGRSEAA